MTILCWLCLPVRNRIFFIDSDCSIAANAEASDAAVLPSPVGASAIIARPLTRNGTRCYELALLITSLLMCKVFRPRTRSILHQGFHIRPTNNFGIAQTQVQQCFDMSTRRHGSQFDFVTGLPVDLAIIPIKVVEGGGAAIPPSTTSECIPSPLIVSTSWS